MARRRRRTRRKRSNRWLTAVQVVFLAGLLIFIILFRDFIADSAGDMFGTFGTGDVEVSDPEQPDEANEAGAPDETEQPDAG
ncbi:MAG: hypothetical protein ACLFVJ_17700 [Persicimonas sp.]